MKTDINGYYNQKVLDELAPTIMIARKEDEQQFDILEYHKNYSSNEKTADEMFKELGYEKEEFKGIYGDLINITYCRNKELNENIEFYLDDKYMYIDNGITIWITYSKLKKFERKYDVDNLFKL